MGRMSEVQEKREGGGVLVKIFQQPRRRLRRCVIADEFLVFFPGSYASRGKVVFFSLLMVQW